MNHHETIGSSLSTPPPHKKSSLLPFNGSKHVDLLIISLESDIEELYTNFSKYFSDVNLAASKNSK